jgi:NH3-dependent NAD+ synthetase
MTTVEMTRNAPAPERSLRQRLDALENANRIRTVRARLKRDVKAHRADALSVLRQPTRDVGTMKVFDLLLAVPGLGRTKVNRLLAREQISPSKTIGGLSARQRSVLLLALARQHGGKLPLGSRA